MAHLKSILPELESNAEPMNGVRRLRTAEENGHHPLVNLRNGSASVHDRWIGRRKPVAAAVMAYLPMARARGAASFLVRPVTRQFVLTTNRGRIKTKAIPVLIGIGLVLSACSANTDYGSPSFAYNDPIRSTFNSDFGYWDGWRGQSFAGFGDGQLGGHVPPPY
jgi:hypothetical protein